MPIAIQCGSCQAKINAPDKLAGKKIKCPKCGQVMAIPASPASIATAPLPVSSAATPVHLPAASDPFPFPASEPPITPMPPGQDVPLDPFAPLPTSPASELPGLSPLPPNPFEALKIPPRLQKSVEKEVGAEQILWMERPTPESLLAKSKIGMWVGLVITILTIIGIVVGLIFSKGTLAILIVLGIGGLILLTMGLPMATMPLWVKWLINYRDCYVLTPTRAIVFDNEKILFAKAKPFTVQKIKERELFVHADGTGSIVFDYEVVNLGTRTSIRTDRKDTVFGKQITYTTKTKEENATKPVGFMDVANVEAVEAMLRQFFGLGPPASKNIS